MILAGRVIFAFGARMVRADFLRWWKEVGFPERDPFDYRVSPKGCEALLPLRYIIKDYHAKIFEAARSFVILGDRDQSDFRVPKRLFLPQRVKLKAAGGGRDQKR